LSSFCFSSSAFADIGLASNSITVFVQPRTKVVVVGTVFTVDICIENVPENGLFSYQLTLSYNNTVLEGINVTLPEGHFLEPEQPNLIFVVQCLVNQTRGKVYLAVTLLGDPPAKMGNGTLATVTFRANSTGNSILNILDIPWDKLILSPQAGPPYEDVNILNGFTEVVSPDLNSDSEVDLQDLTLQKSAFGSRPGNPRWNPKADVNRDNIINIVDVALIAINFGKPL